MSAFFSALNGLFSKSLTLFGVTFTWYNVLAFVLLIDIVILILRATGVIGGGGN